MKKAMILVALLVMCAGCSWQDALITGGVTGGVLLGPPLITTYVYTHEHMAQLRSKCVQSGVTNIDQDVNCQVYFAEMKTCLNHLGLVATEDWRQQCEGV